MKMGSVSLVNDQWHTAVVAKRGHSSHIAGQAVIARASEQHGGWPRLELERLGYRSVADAKRAALGKHLLLNKLRPPTGQNQPGNYRAVDVPRQGNRRAGRHGRKHGGRDTERGPGGEKKRCLRADQIARQLLSIAHAARRVERVIGGRHAWQIERQARRRRRVP